MEKILDYLIKAKEDLSYQEVFENDSKKLIDKICENDSKKIENETNLFEKDKLIKISVSKKYEQNIKLEEAYWIINIWGGIGSFKKNERNDRKINSFLEKLKNGNLNLTVDEFSTISSLSKISFFFDIDRFSIYDSRVIYTLNWIILKNKETKIKLFPMPSGRNEIIVKYPVDSIINFYFLQKGIVDLESYFYKPQEAYLEYNKLLVELSKKLFGENSYPVETERLLFGIVVNYVLNDIKNSVKIQIT